MKETKQTGLINEKSFDFKVVVTCKGEFFGSDVIPAHDSKEAKGIMWNRLNDVFPRAFDAEC